MPDDQLTYSKSKSKIITKLFHLFLFFVSFLMPLWFFSNTFDGVEFDKLLLLVGVTATMLILFLLAKVFEDESPIKLDGIVMALAVFLLFSIVIVFASSYRPNSIIGVGEERALTFASFLSLSFIYLLLINVPLAGLKKIIFLLKCSLLIALGWSLLSLFHLSDTVNHFFELSFSPLGSSRTVAQVAAISLLLFLVPFRGINSEKKQFFVTLFKWTGVIICILLLFAINLVAAWVILFVVFSLYLAFVYKTTIPKELMKNIVILGSLLSVVLIINLFRIPFFSLGGNVRMDDVLSYRQSFDVAINSLKEKPLGYGFENFVLGNDKFGNGFGADLESISVQYTRSESEIFTLIVEGGFAMLVSLIIVGFLYTRKVFSAIRYKFNNSNFSAAMFASSVGIILAFFIQPSSVILLFLLAVLTAFGTVYMHSIGEKYKVHDSSFGYKRILPVYLGLAVSGPLFLATLYFGFQLFQSNVALAHAANSNDGESVASYLVKSLETNNKDTRIHRLLSETLISNARHIVDSNENIELGSEFNGNMIETIYTAVNVSKTATDIDPSNYQNWVVRGRLYEFLVGQVSGVEKLAVDMYKEGLTLSPNNAVLAFKLGSSELVYSDLLEKSGNNNEAKVLLSAANNHLQQALKLAPEFDFAQFNLGAAVLRSGDLEGAIKQFEDLRLRNIQNPALSLELGILYYKHGDLDLAITMLENAIKLSSDYSNARWYLSYLYEEAGEIAMAIDQVLRVEDLNPENNIVKDRIQYLRGLVNETESTDATEFEPVKVFVNE